MWCDAICQPSTLPGVLLSVHACKSGQSLIPSLATSPAYIRILPGSHATGKDFDTSVISNSCNKVQKTNSILRMLNTRALLVHISVGSTPARQSSSQALSVQKDIHVKYCTEMATVALVRLSREKSWCLHSDLANDAC